VAIPVDDAEEIEPALESARAAVRDGARLVEWRVDALVDRLLPDRAAEALACVQRLVGESPAPCIVTIRSASENGAFRGDDTDRVSLLEAIGAGEPAPRYLDFELAAFDRSANLRQKVRLAVAHDRQPRDLKTSLILSSHDFGSRPADLQKRLAAMVVEPACAVAKVAWRARSLRDNLEAFELLLERGKPMVALCMGEFGLMSRVLAPKFGGLFTFARGTDTRETAAGQPTVRELRDQWQFDRIGPATAVYGVIGWPVSHSRSPALQNAGFDALGVDAVYLPMPVEESWESFKATLGAMIDFAPLTLRGVSVTLPHKEHLVRFVRERGGTLCSLSERCGSANTLLISKDERACALHAVNTDAPAAIAAIAHALPGGSREPHALLADKHVALVGAGGVARALAFALTDAGAEVTIFNRTRERATALASSIGARAQVGRASVPPPRGSRFDVIINATSLGMRGAETEGRSPLPDDFEFVNDCVVMETIYTPRLTPLLRRARDGGATVIDGSEMFVRQAEAQFRVWTERDPPSGLFRTTLDALEPSS